MSATGAIQQLPPDQLRYLEQLAERMLDERVKNKAYEQTLLGPDVREYLSFKANEQNRADTTRDTYERVLARLALRLAAHTLTDLELGDLRHERDSYPLPSRRKAATILRDFTKWAWMEGKTPEWVGARLGAPVIPPAPITDLFTSEQQSAIVTATKTARDRACVLLLLRAGVRKGELRHMQVRDINLADKYVLVRRGKGSKFRRVPVKGSLVRALDLLLLEHPPGLSRQLRDDEYVLYANQQGKPGPDGPRANPRQGMSDTATHRWWYQRLADAGIVDVDVTRGRRMHATRHTYATDLGKANKWSMGAMMALQKNLGHARIQTTVDIYTQFAYSEQEAAVELLPEIEGA